MENQDQRPAAKVRILIRKPASEVFRAIITPEILTQFWLAHASGPLEPSKTVQWHFMVPGASEQTTVKHYERDKRLLLEWSDGTTVDWQLKTRPDGHTVLEVRNAGFKGTYAEIVEQALEATQGFSIVLCDLKTLLEHGRPLNLTRDKALLIEEKQQALTSD
jgi:uncharacterized protein YndB with AHSA1/START domain